MDQDKGAGQEFFNLDRLQLKSPAAEFEDFLRAKVATAEQLGDSDDVTRLLSALALGKRYLMESSEEVGS